MVNSDQTYSILPCYGYFAANRSYALFQLKLEGVVESPGFTSCYKDNPLDWLILSQFLPLIL